MLLRPAHYPGGSRLSDPVPGRIHEELVHLTTLGVLNSAEPAISPA